MIFGIIVFVLFVASAEIDICVPAFPEMKQYFGLTPFTTEIILGVNVISHCISAFFAGNLSDRYGKKIVINYGLIMFAIGSYLCYISTTYPMIIIARAIQGAGVAMPAVLAPIVIMDAYPNKDKQQNMVTMLNGFVTMVICLAPAIGSYLTLFFSWRGVFMFLFILSIIAIIVFNIWIPSDKHHAKSTKFTLNDYLEILKSPIAMLAIVMFSIECASYYTFVAMAPIIYIESFQVSLKTFGIYQGILSLAFGLCSVFSAQIIKLFNKKRAFIYSMILYIAFVPMCISAIVANTHSAAYVTATIFVLSVGVAIPLNFTYVFALNSIPGAKARISGIMVVFKWVISTMGFQLASYFYTNNFRSTGIIVVVMELVGIMATILLLRYNARFRREMMG